ncbi:MAG: hypothetical protein ACTHK4_07745, partial [Mycobacteriales bacterium]
AVDGAGGCVIEPADLTDALHRLTGWARRNNVSLDVLQLERPTLEDTYLQLLAQHATAEVAS